MHGHAYVSTGLNIPLAVLLKDRLVELLHVDAQYASLPIARARS